MDYKVYKLNNCNVHTIKTDKFKNSNIEIMLTRNIEKDKVTRRTLLNDLLTYTSKKYKTRRDLAIESENLYNAYVRCSNSRVGKKDITSLSLSFLDPKYCEEGYLEEVVKLPFELLFNPYIEDNKFDKRSFDIVKNRLRADLESMKDNATRYAFKRSFETMDKDSISSIQIIGYLEDLDDINEENLVLEYNDLINNSSCDIYVVGNLDMDNIVELIKKYFVKDKVAKIDKDLFVKNKDRDEVLDVKESGRYEQSSLVVINNLIDLNKRERDVVFHIFNYIFGSGGLTSKLYKYIREENSLCYMVSSNYDKYDGLCSIYAGINAKDKDKCLELINKALKEMIEGDFSEDELNDAKKSIVTSLRATEDTIWGIIGTYLFHNIDDMGLTEEKINNYNSVTKEEVINVAKKIKLNTIYLLVGEDEK